MRKHAAHSDYANTDGDHAVSAGRRMAYIPIIDGYAVGGGWTWPAQDGESKESHKWLAKNPGLGLDGVEVVWPEPNWPTDEWGRGLSVQEVRGNAYLDAEQAVLVEHIAQFISNAPALGRAA